MFCGHPRPFEHDRWRAEPPLCRNAPRSRRSRCEPRLAHWLETIRRLPPVRARKVAAMRYLLASSQYDLASALALATVELWRELSASDYEWN